MTATTIDEIYADFASIGGNVETIKSMNLDYATLADFVARMKSLVQRYNEANRA